MEQTYVEVVGVLGDVHAQDVTLCVALEFLMARPRLDKLLCTGDILGGDGSAQRCCELLQEAGVLSVRGNHERWHFEAEPFVAEIVALAQPEDLATWPVRVNQSARDYLASLPPTRAFRTPRGDLLLCHGLGQDDMAGVLPGEGRGAIEARLAQCGLLTQIPYRFLINGHTHRRMVRQIGSLTLINAGTLLAQPEATFALVDFGSGQAEFFRINEHSEVTRSQTYRLTTRITKPSFLRHKDSPS